MRTADLSNNNRLSTRTRAEATPFSKGKDSKKIGQSGQNNIIFGRSSSSPFNQSSKMQKSSNRRLLSKRRFTTLRSSSRSRLVNVGELDPLEILETPIKKGSNTSPDFTFLSTFKRKNLSKNNGKEDDKKDLLKNLIKRDTISYGFPSLVSQTMKIAREQSLNYKRPDLQSQFKKIKKILNDNQQPEYIKSLEEYNDTVTKVLERFGVPDSSHVTLGHETQLLSYHLMKDETLETVVNKIKKVKGLKQVEDLDPFQKIGKKQPPRKSSCKQSTISILFQITDFLSQRPKERRISKVKYSHH